MIKYITQRGGKMNFNNNEFTLLSDEQTFGSEQIKTIKKIGGKCAISDFAILLGATLSYETHLNRDKSLKGRTGPWCLSSTDDDKHMHVVWEDRILNWSIYNRNFAIRPVLPLLNISDISIDKIKRKHGLLEGEYGEYPQYAVDRNLSKILFFNLSTGKLEKTGKTYTTDSNEYYLYPFKVRKYDEYEYNGKRYILCQYVNNYSEKLSEGHTYLKGEPIWVEVSPIKWIIDEKAQLLVSKIALVSGIRFCSAEKYNSDFRNTEIYQYLNTYFAKDIVPSIEKEINPEENKPIEKQKRLAKIRKPSGLKF